MTQNTLREDTFSVTNYFRVEVDGLPAAFFHGISGPDMQIDVREYKQGGENSHSRKLPGSTRWGNIVLRRGMIDSTDFFDWIMKASQGNVERKTGAIYLMDRDNDTPILQIDFKDAWPCGFKGPDLSTLTTGSLSIEELELTHHGATMKRC